MLTLNPLPPIYGPRVIKVNSGAVTPISPDCLVLANHINTPTDRTNFQNLYGVTITQFETYLDGVTPHNDAAIWKIDNPFWVGYYEISTVDPEDGVTPGISSTYQDRLWGGWGPFCDGVSGTAPNRSFTFNVANRLELYAHAVVQTNGTAESMTSSFRPNTHASSGHAVAFDSGGAMFMINPSGFLAVAAVVSGSSDSTTPVSESPIQTTAWCKLYTPNKRAWISSIIGSVPPYFSRNSNFLHFFEDR